MRVRSRRQQDSAPTPEEVSAVLAGAGFLAAEVDGIGRALTEGFSTWRIPATREDRVGVAVHVDVRHADHRSVAEDALRRCACPIREAGYQVELAGGPASDHLVVWLEGEF